MTNPNPSRWEKVVMLVKNMLENITLPAEISWYILVFISNLNMHTPGISLLKVLWKFFKYVIETWVKTDMQFHDVLHGFHTRQGIGTTTMEINMDQ